MTYQIDENYLVETRRHLHQYPEASLKEFKTSEFIKSELTRHHIPFEAVDKTGVLAIIKGGQGAGRTVLLRADIDALELEDKTGASYASKHDGLNHACGHDAHTAMGLETARILYSLRHTFKGTIKIAFQPAEEIGAGAKQFLAAGVVDDVDEVFAVHVNSGLATGTIAATAGPVNASCDIFKVHVSGKSAHVAQPHVGRDALLAASEIVVALQSIVAREVNPIDTAVVGVGKFHSGSRYNIVANEAVLEGTVRAFSHETRAHLLEAVERIAKQVGQAHRVSVDFERYDAAAPVINDALLAGHASDIAKQVPGVHTVITNQPKSLGADDFADYLTKVPGVYSLVGTQNGEKTAFGHHHECFDIDESALALGVAYEVDYLLSRVQA